MSNPAIIVFPAPGSSARRNRSGCRGNISPYTAVIWCGSGSTIDVWMASSGVEKVSEVDPVRLGDQAE
jgi:hypothetical protein